MYAVTPSIVDLKILIIEESVVCNMEDKAIKIKRFYTLQMKMINSENKYCIRVLQPQIGSFCRAQSFKTEGQFSSASTADVKLQIKAGPLLSSSKVVDDCLDCSVRSEVNESLAFSSASYHESCLSLSVRLRTLKFSQSTNKSRDQGNKSFSESFPS